MHFVVGFLFAISFCVLSCAKHSDGSSLLQLTKRDHDSDDCTENAYEQVLLDSNLVEKATCSQKCLEKEFYFVTASDQAKYVYIHIPKTGGTSFLVDARKTLDRVPLVDNWEQCLGSSTAIWKRNATFVVLFRSPLHHVLSQFLHCKGLNRTKAIVPHGNGGVYGGFEDWIKHFLQLSKDPLPTYFTYEYLLQQAYGCYNPWNMQTRYLVQPFNTNFHLSSTSYPILCRFECHFVSDTFEPNIEIAQGVMTNQIGFVGITDLYVETLCLLHWKVHKDVPQSCACGGTGPLQQISQHDHGVAHHDLKDIPPHLVQDMKKLVQKDVKLYAMALDRFEKDLLVASQNAGIQMVCPDRFRKLRDEIALL